MDKKKSFRKTLIAIFILSLTHNCFAQKKASFVNSTFSDPTAPVENSKLVVPQSVRPILDTWLRDTYVTMGPDGEYYMTGTTASKGRVFPNGRVHCWDYNDGIYLWKSKDLKSWESIGLVWSFDNDGASWQKKGIPIKKGTKSVNGDMLDSMYRALWAPELHYIKSKKKWLIAACINGGMGSFVLESTTGKPEGPYKNIAGNESHSIFPNIDLSIYEDTNGKVYLLGHDHFIAQMNNDLTDVAEPFRRLLETPYNPEPYIEGIYLDKHNNKYQLLQTVWSVPTNDGHYTYLRNEQKDKTLYSYDVVVAEADNIYGPYGPRYPAIIEGGHNNLFKDVNGDWWSTIFFNPRGIMGTRYTVTCRPAVVPVKWANGKLMPDSERANEFYKTKNLK